MYYIISLKHTWKRDKWITLWRPDDAGYTYYKESAGQYENPKKGYHDSDSAVPVKIEIADKLFKEDPDRRGQFAIRNTKANYKRLGIDHLINP